MGFRISADCTCCSTKVSVNCEEANYRLSQKDWLREYESFAQFVVPRSAMLLAEDADYTLYSVTVFKKYAADFSHKCRESKYTPREFEYDESKIQNEQKDYEEMSEEEKKQWVL
jgi:V-type H+-transporting ATPase subunit C